MPHAFPQQDTISALVVDCLQVSALTTSRVFGCEGSLLPNNARGESLDQRAILHTCICPEPSRSLGCEYYLPPSSPRGESLIQCAILHTWLYELPGPASNRCPAASSSTVCSHVLQVCQHRSVRSPFGNPTSAINQTATAAVKVTYLLPIRTQPNNMNHNDLFSPR